MVTMITTFFGIGRLRPAPGTWGSAAAVVLAVLIAQAGAGWFLPIATLLAAGLGFWAVPRAIATSADKDPSEIVIDEVAGQWLTLLFPTAAFWHMGLTNWAVVAYPGWVAAFFFFRLFDIWKPWLVGRADRRGDAKGVMLDDLWAGLFAGIAVAITAGISHGVLM